VTYAVSYEAACQCKPPSFPGFPPPSSPQIPYRQSPCTCRCLRSTGSKEDAASKRARAAAGFAALPHSVLFDIVSRISTRDAVSAMVRSSTDPCNTRILFHPRSGKVKVTTPPRA